jgi:NAD(P)-dependent dehydrogenase (short-subunit alcohol dehydrogenase family)
MSTAAEDLSGRVAVVTGGSRGIGRGIAEALGMAGARVAVLARSEPEVAEAAAAIGGGAIGVRADVADPADVEAAVAHVTEVLGPVDLLVHNAGTAGVIGPLWEADPQAWWDEVAGHVRGAMLTCRAVLPGMLARRSGRVVLMYGNLGEGGDPWSSAYAVGKAGLLRLVEQLAAELADTGVHVLGLHPGLVWTSMKAALAEDPDKQRWLPRFGEWPRERFGTPDAAADLVVRIAGGAADRLTGLLLGVGDDLAALSDAAEELREAQRRTLRTTW